MGDFRSIVFYCIENAFNHAIPFVWQYMDKPLQFSRCVSKVSSFRVLLLCQFVTIST